MLTSEQKQRLCKVAETFPKYKKLLLDAISVWEKNVEPMSDAFGVDVEDGKVVLIQDSSNPKFEACLIGAACLNKNVKDENLDKIHDFIYDEKLLASCAISNFDLNVIELNSIIQAFDWFEFNETSHEKTAFEFAKKVRIILFPENYEDVYDHDGEYCVIFEDE